ncbi:MAG: hypothetical protein GX593_07855 [Actinomycetales bacterium]|nr:hypothetical protein [Actinomycetales bacterium]
MSDDDVLAELTPLRDAEVPPMGVDVPLTVRAGRSRRTRRVAIAGICGVLALAGMTYTLSDLTLSDAFTSPADSLSAEDGEVTQSKLTVTPATTLTPVDPDDPGVRLALDLPWHQRLDDPVPGEPTLLVLGKVGPAGAAASNSDWANALALRPLDAVTEDGPLLVVGWSDDAPDTWSTGRFWAADESLYVVGMVPPSYEGATLRYTIGPADAPSLSGLLPVLTADGIDGQRVVAFRVSPGLARGVTELDLVYTTPDGEQVGTPAWHPRTETP